MNRSGKLWALAVLFGVLAILFYCLSIREVNYGYSSIQIANIQCTVFSAACAVICMGSIIGALVAGNVEDLNKHMDDDLSTIRSIIDHSEQSTENSSANTKPNVKPIHLEHTETASISAENKAPNAIDASWTYLNNGRVKCPQCDMEMTLDFIRVRGVCPNCGKTFTLEDNANLQKKPFKEADLP